MHFLGIHSKSKHDFVLNTFSFCSCEEDERLWMPYEGRESLFLVLFP